MKTSNKILLAIISIIGLSLLSILIFAKGSLLNIKDGTVNGNGKITIETVEIGEISFFKAGGIYEVFVQQGEPKLVIKTDENIQAFVYADFDDIVYNGKNDASPKKRLKLKRFENAELIPTNGIKIYLTTPLLESVDISGFVRLTCENELTNENFKVFARGSSELDLKLATDNIEINSKDYSIVNVQGRVGDSKITSKGSSEVVLDSLNAQDVSIEAEGKSILKLKGSTQKLNISAKGSTDISAKNLSAEEAIVKADGESSVSLNTNKKLNIEAGGTSKIQYSGSPEITKNISEEVSLTAIEKE